MDGQSPRVTLPGTMYQRGNRWWWCVQLPGEEKAKPRSLKEKGTKAAVADLPTAEALALEVWEQAIREQAVRQIEVESAQKIASLKAQFLDRVHRFTEIVEQATAKAEAEARARAEAEARLQALTQQVPTPTSGCDCCGAKNVPTTRLQRIDSGQILCARCLAALRAEAIRIPPAVPGSESM